MCLVISGVVYTLFHSFIIYPIFLRCALGIAEEKAIWVQNTCTNSREYFTQIYFNWNTITTNQTCKFKYNQARVTILDLPVFKRSVTSFTGKNKLKNHHLPIADTNLSNKIKTDICFSTIFCVLL